MTTLIFILLFSFSYGIEAGIRAAANFSTIVAFKDNLLPIIVDNIKEIVLKDIKGSNGPLYFHLRKVVFYPAKILPSQVKINLVENKNEIKMRVEGLSGKGNFDGTWEFLFLDGNFYGTVSINGVSSEMTTKISNDENGRLNLIMKDTILYITANNIQITFHGSIIEKVLNFLEPVIKLLMLNDLARNIERVIPQIVNELFKQLAAKIPYTIDIGHDLVMRMKFPESPIVNNNNLVMDIEGCIVDKNDKCPDYKSSPYPKRDLNTTKGIYLFVNDYPFKTALESAYKKDLLNMYYVFDSPLINVSLYCYMMKVPALNIKQRFKGKAPFNFIVTLNPMCNVTAKNKIILMTFNMNGDVTGEILPVVNDQLIHFQVLNVALHNLKVDNPNGHSMNWLKNMIQPLLNRGMHVLNLHLKKYGFPLPYMKELKLTEVEVGIKDYIELLGVPIINITNSDFSPINFLTL